MLKYSKKIFAIALATMFLATPLMSTASAASHNPPPVRQEQRHDSKDQSHKAPHKHSIKSDKHQAEHVSRPQPRPQPPKARAS